MSSSGHFDVMEIIAEWNQMSWSNIKTVLSMAKIDGTTCGYQSYNTSLTGPNSVPIHNQATKLTVGKQKRGAACFEGGEKMRSMQ